MISLTKIKKGLILAIVGVFTVATLLTAFLLIPKTPVDAFDSESDVISNSVVVGDIWNSSTKTFNRDTLGTLLKYISSDGTINGVNTNEQTAQDIRGYTYGGKTSGKSVVVTIGGYKWQVVYLTRRNEDGGDRNGDRIATLLMVNNDGTATISHGGYDNGSNWSNANPSNMYGASYMRAVTLNNGGTYANITASNSNSYSTATATQSSTHKYALYTVASQGLTQYLVQPKDVWYQTQSQGSGSDRNGTSYILNNESLATNITSGWYNSSYSYQSKANYTQWGTDYLWLPSLSEAGVSENAGIWKLSETERSASSDWWSRSGHYSNSSAVYYLDSSGSGYAYGAVSASNGVRPALHLNLDSAALRAAQDAVSTTLDGNVSVTATYSSNENGAEDVVTLTFSPKNPNVSKISLAIDSNPIIISASEASAQIFINADNKYQYKCYNDENGSIVLIIRAIMQDINVTATSVGVNASVAGGSGTIESYREGDVLYVIAHPATGQYVNTITIDNATITPTYYKAQIYGAGNAINVRYTAMDASNLFVLEFEKLFASTTVVFNLSTVLPDYEVPPTVNGGGGVGIVGTVAAATSGGEVRMVGNDIANGADTDTVTFIAVAYSGYRFVGWVNANDEDESFGNSDTISLTKEQVNGKVIKAVFEKTDTEYTTNGETNNQDEIM